MQIGNDAIRTHLWVGRAPRRVTYGRLAALLSGLLAAALLLAPGEARALIECGPSGSNVLTCSGATYNDGIYYPNSAKLAGTNPTVSVPGRSAGSTTITAGSSQAVGIHVESQATHGFTVNVGGSTGGTAHVVNIVQGTNTNTDANRNNGVYLRQLSNNRSTTLDVRSGVTIGSSTAPMKQNGIYVDLRPTASSLGVGATAGTITSAATIHAARQGIRIVRQTGGTNDATTVTNTGAIHSGVGNAAATGSYVDRPHGIYALHGGTQRTGSLTVTNSGDITVGGAYTGILMNYWGAGALSLDNRGDIAAATGQTAKQGIQFNYKYWDNQSAQAITLTNSGDITASEFGIRLTKLSGGAVELTNSGAITVTGDAAQHAGHAIYLAEGVTFGEGRTYAANGGALTVDNSGVLSSKNHALYVYLATADDDVELENSGDVVSEEGDGIRIERVVEGDVAVENSGSVSGKGHGIYVGQAARIDFEQSGSGTIRGRTGVTLQVTRENAMGDTRSVDDDGNHVPAIDVAWTGGSIAGGTAESDAGRFRAATAAQALAFDREAAAAKALEESVRYGAPAGVEARVLSWRDVVTQVAKGDDPGAFANAAAQLTAVPTGATAGDNAYVAQLRAALGNEELAVAAAVLTAIDSSATSLADVTDAEIVTYLQTDNGATRTLLRNVLAQGLSDDEKAILRAVATNDGVDAALTAAGFSDDTSNDSDYWSLVKALLDRHNLDDIRVSMTAGSIASRGDGVRAYYATPHDDNGSIEVTVAGGVSVTGGTAGVLVANAGVGDDGVLKQTVTVNGAVTGGTDAGVHLVGGGRLTVGETGEVLAGASGRAILVNDPGPAEITINGLVRGGAGAEAAVDVTGGGSVTIGARGRLEANGAGMAIRGEGAPVTVEVHVSGRDDAAAREAGSRVQGAIGGTDLPQGSVKYVEVMPNGARTGWTDDARFDADGALVAPEAPREPGQQPGGEPTPGTGEEPDGGEPGQQPGQRPGGGGQPGTGGRQPTITFTFDCAGADDRRCELYEALPSVLLAMNRMPAYAERMAAPRGANGVWARMEAARGEWTADRADSAMELAYDYGVSGGRAGFDLEGTGARVGLSVHALRAKAEMSGVGEIALNGMGFGASAAWEFGEFYADVSGQATWLDAEIDSNASGKLEKEATGLTGALGVEVGRRTRLAENLAVTPRLGLVWTEAGLGEFFTDSVSATRVSIEDARSVRGALGVTLETPMANGGRLLGTLDLARELADETGVKVGDAKLSTDVDSASARLGLAGAFALSEDVGVRASAWWMTSGSDSDEYGGSLDLSVRF